MLKNTWHLILCSDSLWEAWIHKYLIKNRSFWALKEPGDCSWCWRKILQLREQVWPSIVYKIQIGSCVFFWFDQWLPIGPLIIIAHEVYNISLVSQQLCLWVMCLCRALGTGPVAQIFRQTTSKNWQLLCHWGKRICLYGLLKTLEASQLEAFETPTRTPIIFEWTKMIWFSGNIPRASVISCLAWLDHLATRESMLKWNIQLPSTLCKFCGTHLETHDHLFFSCDFSKTV